MSIEKRSGSCMAIGIIPSSVSRCSHPSPSPGSWHFAVWLVWNCDRVICVHNWIVLLSKSLDQSDPVNSGKSRSDEKKRLQSENAGLLALTRVGSRRVVQIFVGFMIFFSILRKFGAVFASFPTPIVAALYCLCFAYVGAVGLSILQFVNLNSFYTKFILGFSIFLGLSIPQYFNEYTAITGFGPVHTSGRWSKPKKEKIYLDEAVDDSENLTDFLVDFDDDE